MPDQPRAGFVVTCFYCNEHLTEPGALLFGPPDDEGTVIKRHICVRCYPTVGHPAMIDCQLCNGTGHVP